MPPLAYAKQQTGRALAESRAAGGRGRDLGLRHLSLALLLGVGFNAAFGWWWADPVAALAMLPVIVWQGWETLEEAREEQSEETRRRLLYAAAASASLASSSSRNLPIVAGG